MVEAVSPVVWVAAVAAMAEVAASQKVVGEPEDMEECTAMGACILEAEAIAVATTLAGWDQGVVAVQDVVQGALDVGQVMTQQVSCRMLVQEATTNRKPPTGTWVKAPVISRW